MPSIIHQSAAMDLRGLALVSQSVQEQVTGLVNVSVEYVTATPERVSDLFYTDAPPPIWPTSVDEWALQNRSLYMVSRNMTKANGLTTISAEYAGGLLARNGSPTMLISTEREGPFGYSNSSAAQTIYVSNYPNAPTSWEDVTTSLTYTPAERLSYYAIAHEYIFVSIDGYRPELPLLGDRDLFSIISFFKNGYAEKWNWFSSPRKTIVAIDYNEDYFANILRAKEVITDEKPSFVTPTVKLVTLRKYIQ
jgi:hypothetical protein